MEINQTFESRPQVTPKDFFMNLGWVITLYGSIISLLSLLFATIDRVFPDAVNQYYYGSGYSGGIRWAIAWLVVVFPIYIIITYYFGKIFRADPSKREIWVRKWLIYLTLFLSSAAVIVDLIVVINSFLGGELTMRFLLKVLATLVVSGAVFGYYFYDLRTEGKSGMAGKIFAISSIVIVVASLVWAFVVIGSPMTERSRRFDEQKVQNLQSIQWQVINYWQSKGKLPENLGDLIDSVSGYVPPTEPDSALPYVYEKTGTKSFKLCAEFNLSSDNNETPVKPIGYMTDSWNHGKGQVCFDKVIDEELYPVRKDAVPIIKANY